MRKSEVEFHSDGFGAGRPAVNVKVYGSIRNVELPMCLGRVKEAGESEFHDVMTDPRFDFEWIDEHVSDSEGSELFDFACMVGWEDLQSVADDIFGPKVKVYSEGRSGGWAVVDGLPDFDSWDAIDVSRWSRFAKAARAIADDIPRVMVESVYVNDFESWADEQVRDYDHARA